MNIFRPQRPYVFCPPKYAGWFRPILHVLSASILRHRFKVRAINVRGAESLAQLVREQQSILVAPNHADHSDAELLIEVGRRHGIAFHFMAARECFERGRMNRFVLQRSGAFSVDREGADVNAIRTAMRVLLECRHPLVIFPEGEIYHHHEELDILNDGVATILLRSVEKLPETRKGYIVPTAIQITHDPAVSDSFSERLDALESRITWKPNARMDPVERIYRLGSTLLAIKEEEFIGAASRGPLVERIENLRRQLVEQAEREHGLQTGVEGSIPSRIKALRHVIRKELNSSDPRPSPAREERLYDDLDRLFVAQQLYSYPGQYLRENPTLDRIAETIFKLEEDVLEKPLYPAPRQAEVVFDEPVDVREFLRAGGWTAKTGVQAMTELLRQRIQSMMRRDRVH